MYITQETTMYFNAVKKTVELFEVRIQSEKLASILYYFIQVKKNPKLEKSDYVDILN